VHHSRPRGWIERARRSLTGKVPFRCRACNWRGWRDEFELAGSGPRDIHRELTEAEIAGLEPGNDQGEST
jgi:hypothetical protein